MFIRNFISRLLKQKYDRLLDKYYDELNILSEKREAFVQEAFENEIESNVNEDTLQTIKNAIDSFEDEERTNLKNKYKRALRYGEMRFGGSIEALNGFKLVIHSNDHGQHLHAIHKGRGIDVRFSFPDMSLINFAKGSKSMNRKDEKRLIEFCKSEQIFRKLDREFKQRKT